MSPLAWCVVIGIMLGIELYLAWRVATALSRGSVVIDPLIWLPAAIGFDFEISRARYPVWFWLGVLTLVIFFAVVLAFFVTVAAINVHASNLPAR